MPADRCDVLVMGGGNAALCAALSARERGADVLVLECAPPVFRGGNSRHTRNLRMMHEAPAAVLTGSYPEDEYYNDLLRVTGGQTDPELARLTIHQSAACWEWMRGYGVRFQPSLEGTLQLERTNAFFLGGGKALMNTWYRAAEKRGVRVLYNAEVTDLEIADGAFQSAEVTVAGVPRVIRAKAVVAAAGGFEANLEWLKDAWGEAAEQFIVRGTPYNKGRVLRLLLDCGVQPVGDATQCHAVAVDARAPKFDGGIVTRLDSISLGIVVNRDGVRFYDEGEDLWPKRYAIWGRLIAQQPGQIAYSVTDAKAAGQFMPSVFPPLEANSIEELAHALGIAPEPVAATVRRYNDAVVEGGKFDHAVLDGCRTSGLAPEKTNWARRIDTPPFVGYPLRPGITFTYLGVKVNQRAEVIMKNGATAANIFAAGEIMAGNILGKGYLAGLGMTIGTVFGRISGGEAANRAAA